MRDTSLSRGAPKRRPIVCRTNIQARKSIHRVWNAFCFTGFLYQVIAISLIYFNYEVDNSISIASSTGSPLASSIQFPDYTVCFDTESLIERKLLNSVSIDPFDSPLSNLTIEQIMRNTPDTSSLIDKCISRFGPNDDAASVHRSSLRARMYSKSDCYKMFDVKKSIFEENTCYAVSLKGDKNIRYRLRSIVYSGKWSRLLYLFYLNSERFHTINVIKPLIHPRGTLPYKTYAYSPWFARKWHDESTHNGEGTRRAHFNSVKSSNVLYKIHRLKPPYESKCFDYDQAGFTGQEDCIQKCLLKEMMSKLNAVPFTSYIDTPIHLTQLSMNQLESNNSSQIVRSSDEVCFNKCHRPSCFSQISITSGESELHPTLRLIVFTPSSPDIIVTEEIAFRLLDYLIYLFSCFGSWFGLCWFTLNPIKLYDDLKTLHPKMHVRCLTANVKQFKQRNTIESIGKMTSPPAFRLRSRSHVFSVSKRYSKFNVNYNPNISFLSNEMSRIKSFVINEVGRMHNYVNNEITKIKVEIKNINVSMKEITDTLVQQVILDPPVFDSPDTTLT